MELEFRAIPYPHAVGAAVVARGLADALLERLEAQHWRSQCESGYRFETSDSDEIRDLLQSRGVLDELHRAAETFHHLDRLPPQVAIQRYGERAEISPHTDSGVREVRFVLNVNRAWTIEQGGLWLLSSDRGLSPPRRCLPPISNTGFMFVPAANTFHAMTRVAAGVSHGVIVAFAASQSQTAPHR